MEPQPPYIKETPQGLIFYVRVQPGTKKFQIVGPVTGLDPQTNQERTYLRIKLSSPPVEGAANKELIQSLAKKLKIPSSSIQILSGYQSRNKIIRITSLSVEPTALMLRLKRQTVQVVKRW